MPRPYAHWDPAWNAADVVAAGSGPLVVPVTDLDRLERLVTVHAGMNMFADPMVGYQQTVAPETGYGIRVDSSQYLPAGLQFFTADPALGEPLPLDAADALGAPWSTSPRWLHLGWRLQVRGVLGSLPSTGGRASLTVDWADGVGTRVAGDTRGGYTGAFLRTVVQVPGLPPALHHAWGLLHGKRPQDVNWSYHPCKSTVGGVTPGALSTHNHAASDRIRLEYAGGNPCTVALQRWTGGAWSTIYTDAEDLSAYIAAVGDWPTRVQIVGDLVAGAALDQPVTPSSWPAAITRFGYLEFDQFEPYVPDRAGWSEREWSEHWTWLTLPTPFLIERRRPVMDLMHHAPELAGGPAALRAGDDDMGVGVGCGATTVLTAWAGWDQAGHSVTPLVSPVPCDEAAYGYRAPFCIAARVRLNMATWSTTVPVDLLMAGTLWSGTPATDNGIGLHWAYTGPAVGQGQLVVTYWDDGLSSWATLNAPFHMADWDGVPVILAVAWSGARGGDAGRPNYELRLVVNGYTRAAVAAPNMRLRGCALISVGSDRAMVDASRQSFVGLFREGMVFGDAVSDDDLVRCWDDTAVLQNPGFEADDVRPGEAVGWTWEVRQAIGAWAAFNMIRSALAAWQTDQENFRAGWRFAPTWIYADEAERLAAVGFVPADVGGVAWQWDDDTLWLLTSDSPITWSSLAIPGNEGWVDALVATYAIFNAAAGAYAGALEHFAIWAFPVGTTARTPWVDAWTWLAPWGDTLGPGAGPTGWTGWFAEIYGAGLHPCPLETFGESWGNDPLSTAGGPMWVGGGAHNGRRYSAALTFPLTVPPDKHLLWFWVDDGRIVRIDIPAGTYATATALAAALASSWSTAVGAGTGTTWGTWTIAGNEGIWWGWNGTSNTSIGIAPLRRDADPDDDARAVLGMQHAREGRVRLRADEVLTVPGVVAAEETFGLDGWRMLLFDTLVDPYCSDRLSAEEGRIAAVFGAFDATPDPTIWERCTLPGWVGAGAAWDPGFTPGELTAALFDAGTDPQEQFFDSEWPEELLA